MQFQILKRQFSALKRKLKANLVIFCNCQIFSPLNILKHGYAHVNATHVNATPMHYLKVMYHMCLAPPHFLKICPVPMPWLFSYDIIVQRFLDRAIVTTQSLYASLSTKRSRRCVLFYDVVFGKEFCINGSRVLKKRRFGKNIFQVYFR